MNLSGLVLFNILKLLELSFSGLVRAQLPPDYPMVQLGKILTRFMKDC